MYTQVCSRVLSCGELHLPALCDDDRELRLVVGSNRDVLVGQRNTHSRPDVKQHNCTIDALENSTLQ